jgi:hypothetical protein
LASEFHQLHEPKIYMICSVMKALVYGAEKISTTQLRQFQVGLNSTRKAGTTCSDANCQKAIEQLKHEIHQVTPAVSTLFDKLFQRNKQQLLQEVGTRATGPRSKLAHQLAQINLAPKTRLTGQQT